MFDIILRRKVQKQLEYNIQVVQQRAAECARAKADLEEEREGESLRREERRQR